jgi:hypothetical protein
VKLYTLDEAIRYLEVRSCAEGNHEPATVIHADVDDPILAYCRCSSVRWLPVKCDHCHSLLRWEKVLRWEKE